MSAVTVLSKSGQALASNQADNFVSLLNIPDSGEVMAELGKNFKKAAKLVVEEGSKEATITLKVKLKPCKSDAQLFDVEASSTVTAPARKFVGATFISKEYEPSVNRDDQSKFLYHSRG